MNRFFFLFRGWDASHFVRVLPDVAQHDSGVEAVEDAQRKRQFQDDIPRDVAVEVQLSETQRKTIHGVQEKVLL